MTDTKEVIVRADSMGRMRYTVEQRTALLDAFATSGLIGPKFAELHGVNYQTFATWLYKRKRAGGIACLPPPASLALVEVIVPAAPPVGVALTVLLPGGG
ncbi:MAG: IS66 family insertion sequence hypothetical protein [Proteobacteria bacterium]|nr:MAG: IS66 family insertion sequence hypothetical protein [Pseudomonadota bacterium]